MNSVRSNDISLKYQRFTTLDSRDIGIIKSEFVAKTQFLSQGIPKLWSYTQTNRQTENQMFIKERLLNEC